MMRRLFIFLFALTTVLSVPVGVSATTPDIKCKTCGKVISKCPYKGKHPVPSSEKKCSKCGKVISKCPYKGNHPSTPTAPATPRASYSNGVLTVNGVSYRMVYVDGGTFQMGATPEQQDPYSNEKPAHYVTLSSYYIGQTEVTQGLWKAVMGGNPSYFTGDDRLPVEEVSWNDCQTFINKLNSMTGEHFRLPTEAEWEFAARGGRQSRGYQYSGSSSLGDVAWYTDNSGSKTHPVASKQPNELGLYDMSGNVYEWCQDYFDSYSSSAQTNPTGPGSGSYRVNRGGCWTYYAWNCRTAYRNDNAPTYTNNNLGFRLAR